MRAAQAVMLIVTQQSSLSQTQAVRLEEGEGLQDSVAALGVRFEEDLKEQGHCF